jgi:hypothetical protein
MKHTLPTALTDFHSLADWLRQTAIAYDREGLKLAADDLLEIERYVETVEADARTGRLLSNTYTLTPELPTYADAVLASVLEAHNLEPDVFDLWDDVLKMFGTPGDMDGLEEHARRLMAYRDALAHVLGVAPDHLDSLPTEELEGIEP